MADKIGKPIPRSDRGAINDQILGDVFDPTAESLITDRIRPHWSQDGAIVFVTFRTIDSIPKPVLQQWHQEKNAWLERFGLLQGKRWSDVLPTLDEKIRVAFHREFDRTREAFLDTCHGRCVLRRPELGQIVYDSLLHFDNDRYRMGDFVVMPNHVHLLAAFPSAMLMEKQFDSWLHFTAFEINKVLGEKGHFWQQEPFDHLVRSVDQYDYLRSYIANNPSKAKLREGEFLYRRYGR